MNRTKEDYKFNESWRTLENYNNSKKLWKQLKNLGYSGKSKENSKIVLKIEDELCFNGRKISTYFNKFFTTVASSLVSKLPYADRIFTTDL